jgi:predicted nucleic acid-binding protein
VLRWISGIRTDVAERAVLIDTGFVVALVNRADPDHARCVAAWAGVRASLLTVEGVLVEAAHLLRRTEKGAAAALALVRASGADVVAPTDARYDRALWLMAKYADVPMDLVDALLVALAEERRARDVLSLDRRGFGVYRIGGRGRFRILP